MYFLKKKKMLMQYVSFFFFKERPFHLKKRALEDENAILNIN